MNKYFNGFGYQSVTLPCASEVKKGDLVFLDTASSVIPGISDNDFLGVCEEVRGDYASIAFKGYVELAYTGEEPTTGHIGFMCSSANTVKVNSEAGRKFTVVYVDTKNKKVGIIL